MKQKFNCTVIAICCSAGLAVLSITTDAQARRTEETSRTGATPAPRRDSSPPAAPKGTESAGREAVRADWTPSPQQRNNPAAPNRDVSPGRPNSPTTTGQRPTVTPRNDPRRPGNRPSTTGQRPGQRPGDNRPGVRPYTPTDRPFQRISPPVGAQRIFTRSQEGRRYDNGIRLRRARPTNLTWQRRCFPIGRYHYPYYSSTYISASVVISPYAFYFGVCAPYILRSNSYRRPPAVIYVEVPVYVGNTSRGYGAIPREDSYLSLYELLDREPGLANAVDCLRETFRAGNIEALVTLMDPNVRIAVFLKGEYDYSLDPADYIDLTRDAILSTDTIAFDLTRIHERAAGVYVVSGEHVYRGRDGRSRTVYVSFVLENFRGVWTLTQVGTSPDRIEEW